MRSSSHCGHPSVENANFTLFVTLVLGDSLREFVTRALVLISGFGEADSGLSVGEHARHNRLQGFDNQRVQTELARERQVLMVLESAPEICELNRVDWPRDSAIL